MFQDNSPKVFGTVVTLLVAAWILFPLRVHTRLKHRTWGTDDTCMAVAMPLFTILSGFCLTGSLRGIGTHESRLSDAQQSQGLEMFFFFEIFYCATIIPIKLSIAFMLVRIATPRKPYIWSLYGISIMFTTMNVIAFFYIMFHCAPVQYVWDTSIPGGSCGTAATLADIYYACTAVNIVTDWFCALLPVPLLWNVQLNRNAKVSVACLLSLGVFASLSACIRLNYTINLTNSDDYLYGVGDIVIWGYAENGIGVIVGCISTLRPLFRKLFRLGGSDPSAKSKPVWPTHERRAYEEFEGGYEMPSSMRRDNKTIGLTTVKVTRSSSSNTPDSSSEEHILSNVGGIQGIQISRTVLQEASYDKTIRDGAKDLL